MKWYKFVKFVNNNYWKLFTVILIGLIATSGLAFASLKPQTIMEEQRKSKTLYEYKADYSVSSKVSLKNPIWEEGRLLENRPVYFKEISPNVTIGFSFDINPNNTIVGSYNSKLIFESVEGNNTYWRKEEILQEKDFKSEEGKLIETIELSIPRLEEKLKRIQEGIKFYRGNKEIKLNSIVNYKTEVNGKNVTKNREFVLPINLQGASYEIQPEEFEGKEDITVKVKEEEKIKPSLFDKILYSSTPMVLIFLLSVFTVIKVKIDVPNSEEIEELKIRKDHEEYEEMISSGRKPNNIDMKRIEIETLEDLVKIAIDTEERVIHDEDNSMYFVIHGNTFYSFNPSKF